MPPNYGAFTPHGRMQDTRRRVWGRHRWLSCLGGLKQHTSKNREKMVHLPYGVKTKNEYTGTNCQSVLAV